MIGSGSVPTPTPGWSFVGKAGSVPFSAAIVRARVGPGYPSRIAEGYVPMPNTLRNPIHALERSVGVFHANDVVDRDRGPFRQSEAC